MAVTEKEVPGIGRVQFNRTPRARRLSIKLRPFHLPRVVVPAQVSLKKAEEFVRANKEWLQKGSARMAQSEQAQQVFIPETEYYTANHQLAMHPQARAEIRVKVAKGQINVCYPKEWPAESTQVQEAVKKGIIRALRKEAKAYLPYRVQFWAEKTGLHYRQVQVKNMKTRWGSCTAQQHINLNIHLMRLPEELIDYVILHELAHTREKNHQQGFWRLLNTITGNCARDLDKKLKHYRIDIL